VANANEAVILIRELAALPVKERIPIISHWGVSGGPLAQISGPNLRKVEFSVVQTYSFIGATDPVAKRVVAAHDRLFKTSGARTIASPVGVAHAYDLTHLLARAVDKAGSTDRKAVRDALERLGPWQGLIRSYAQPFTPARHEALEPELVFMAEYGLDGAIERIKSPRRRAVED
jgi:branched-chain amino acid transport system substrate-binding protein